MEPAILTHGGGTERLEVRRREVLRQPLGVGRTHRAVPRPKSRIECAGAKGARVHRADHELEERLELREHASAGGVGDHRGEVDVRGDKHHGNRKNKLRVGARSEYGLYVKPGGARRADDGFTEVWLKAQSGDELSPVERLRLRMMIAELTYTSVSAYEKHRAVGNASQARVPLDVGAREIGSSPTMRRDWAEFGDEELRRYNLAEFADEVELRLAADGP